MKKLLATCCVAVLSFLGASAHANIVTPLHLKFSSGAVFDGAVTFADNYAGMLDTNGTLSGGPYATTNFNWTWWAGTGQTNPKDYDGDSATYEDILMGGAAEPGFTTFIGLSWYHGNLGDAPVLNLAPLATPNANYWHAIAGGSDVILSGGFGTVPEPGTLALLGLGLAGFAASRRRKQ